MYLLFNSPVIRGVNDTVFTPHWFKASIPKDAITGLNKILGTLMSIGKCLCSPDLTRAKDIPRVQVQGHGWEACWLKVEVVFSWAATDFCLGEQRPLIRQSNHPKQDYRLGVSVDDIDSLLGQVRSSLRPDQHVFISFEHDCWRKASPSLMILPLSS